MTYGAIKPKIGVIKRFAIFIGKHNKVAVQESLQRYSKETPTHRSSPVNIAKFLRTAFSI